MVNVHRELMKVISQFLHYLNFVFPLHSLEVCLTQTSLSVAQPPLTAAVAYLFSRLLIYVQ